MARNKKPKHFKSFGEVMPNPTPEPENEKTWQELQDEDIKQRKAFRPKTKNQERFVNGILTSVLTIATGPAGTGRSYVSIAIAAQLLLEGKIDKVIVTKPVVACGGNSMGYLPGDSFEKMKPFISQLMAYLEDFLGKKTLDSFMKEEKIIFAPINEMRGSSFSQCMVIVDEAQNLNEIELKMVLTRIGENCRMVINGDCKQSDLVFSKDAFFAITGKLRPLTEISFVRFTKEDIVRSGIVRRIIEVLEED
jgi:phosphate starvation-inducible PhoH-like protein